METSEVNKLLEGQITFAKEEDGLKIYYVLPQEERQDRERAFRVFNIGQPADRPTRCILLLGETEEGKTTFINAAINYLYGVRFEDSFRLQVKEETEDDCLETKSQTDLITAYTIYYKEGMKHEYNFVLIDTPGLADTRETQQQHDTRCCLEAFLTSDFGVDLNCIGLVAKANTNRDSYSEKAVLGEITSLLGNNVPDITHIIATFAADRPTVDAVVRNAGVSFKSMFEFDNGTLFTPANPHICSQRQHTNLSYRWDNMNQQYETFFDALVNASSVNLEILREEKLFDICKKNLRAELEKLATLVRAMDISKETSIKYEQQKAVNESWMQEEIVENYITVNLQDGLHALNCNLCQQTCMVFKYDNCTGKSPERAQDGGAGGKSDEVTANKIASVGAFVTTAIPKSGLRNVAPNLQAFGIDVGAQDGDAGGKFDMVTAYNTIASAGDLVNSAIPKKVRKGLRKRTTNLQTFGIGVGVGALVAGGAAVGIYSFTKHKKNKQKKLGDVVCDKDSVCGKNGCSHTIKEHNETDEIIVKENEIQKKTDDYMKKLYDEAVSKINDANTKICNSQQEILSSSRSISHSTVDLLNHAKRIQELTSQDTDYIEDVGSQLMDEIRLGENNIISHAEKYVNILTEAMRRLVSYTAEDVPGKHKLVEEMLLGDHEQLFNSTQRQDI